MPFFTNEAEAITYIFRSMRKLRGQERGPDELTRDISPTRRLLMMTGLMGTPREYAVVTGSKGKGSTTTITAKLLQHLGHRVGTITSPHLVNWRERIRINGQVIPELDFFRILSELAPSIDEVEAHLNERQYFSPQGIFLAIALRWWDEQDVKAAVLEVGRGGRFDDISVVPNKLSLFSPIMLEHAEMLGPTVERIAWHKAGIMKPYSYAYSVPQAPEVLDVLQAEADTLGAEFSWIAPKDMGEYVGSTENGIRMRLGRYGEMTLSLLGRYEIDNATLAVIGAGNMHTRLGGEPSHASPEYLERIRNALADVKWPGRCQKLQDDPAVYIDGAITVASARSFIESLEGRLTKPVATIIAVPIDRDYESVYKILAPISDSIILTENAINIKIRFPEKGVALETARRYHSDVTYADSLSLAVDMAKARVGRDGTVVIAAAQPVVGEAMLLWGYTFDQL
jgi:dihydrofolate synthase / folylpolyglutamate synthase